jgi:O-antigen/teichoic acid export membrane protein
VTANIAANWRKIATMAPTARQAYWAMLSQVVSGAAAFLTSVIVIREAGLAEFGRFSIAALLVITVKNFAEGLILAPMASIGPKLSSFSQVPYRGFVLFNALAFFVSTALFICGGFIVASWITGAEWLWTIALPVAFASAASGFSDFFRRQQFLVRAPARSFGLEAFRYALQLALLIAMVLVSPVDLSATNAIMITGLSALASSIAGYVLFGRWTLRKKMTKATWRRHWNFMRWMLPSVGFETVQTMFPFLYASAVLGEATLGVLRAAHQITSLLNLPFNALLQVIPALAAAKLAQEGLSAVRHFLRIIGGVMALATATMGLVVWLLSAEISLILGITNAADFGLILLLFMVVNVVNAFRFSNMILVNTVEQTWINLAASAIGAVAAICLSIALAPQLGEIGILITFIAVALLNWLTLHLWHRKSHRDLSKIRSPSLENQ